MQQLLAFINDGHPTALAESLMEGAAEFIAEMTSGDISNSFFKQPTKGHEKEIETAFVADKDNADLRPGDPALGVQLPRVTLIEHIIASSHAGGRVSWSACYVTCKMSETVRARTDMKLADLRVVVTGAGSGLGMHAAEFLLRDGASVAAVDIDRSSLSAMSRRHASLSDALHCYTADVGKEDQVIETVRKINSDLGSINCLLNYAGIYLDGLLVRQDGAKLPLAQWRRVVDTDLTGTFLMAREITAAMLESKTRPGLIVNIASISRHGNAGQSPYSAAKAAVVSATRSWSRELAPYGIRVVAISPGLIETPILGAMPPDMLNDYVRRIPMGRLGKPDEINSAIRFAIECEYFTGECIEVNGGFLF